MSKIALDVAKADIDKWLNYKKVKPGKRESYSDNIEKMIEAVQDGTMIVEKDHKLKYKLAFPLKNSDKEETVTHLTFVPRLTVREITARMKGIKSGDADARVMGYVAALTNTPAGVLGDLDTEDNSICQAIATFFL